MHLLHADDHAHCEATLSAKMADAAVNASDEPPS
jgi:hypothetical protein